MDEIAIIPYIVYNIIALICIVLILKWKNYGFITFCISSLIIIIFSLCMSNPVLAIYSLLNALLLFTVLQIKKNKLSAWAYLRGTYPKNYKHRKENPKQNGLKCNACKQIFSSGYTACPHCNSKDIIENVEASIQNINPIKLNSSEETKKCRKCGEKVDINIFICPKCKGEAFI